MSKNLLFSSVALICLMGRDLYAAGGTKASQESSSCGSSKCPMRVTAQHIEGNGIGYNQGYTTLKGFFSPFGALAGFLGSFPGCAWPRVQ